MPKIIVTGPESCGKTTLCDAISKHFKIPYNKEYAREYLTEIGREYSKKDLLAIAIKQLKNEKKRFLLDTDLITIKIWSIYKYGDCEEWILEQIESQKKENRFYLLCKPDIKWVSDPLRENPEDRIKLFDTYLNEISTLNHKYHIVEGENRISNSLKIVSTKLFK